MAEKSPLEILEEAKRQFFPPPLAPLTWRKPATVKVGGFDVTEKQIDEMILEIKKSTSKKNKPKIDSNTFPEQSLEQIQETASEIAQRRNDLRLAISATDGIDVVLGNETLTLNEAIEQEQNLTILNNQYKNAINRRRPSSERAKDPDSNLQVGLETAQSNADSAYAEMLQEIIAFPETSQPYRDRYFASLKILDQAETKALDKGLTIPKTVTVKMGLPKRDITAPSTTAEALKKPVTTRLPSGVAAQQDVGATVVTPMEDRAEQVRFARIKTGELRPGTKVTPTPTGEPAPTETVVDRKSTRLNSSH